MDKVKTDGRTDKALKNTAYGIVFKLIDILLAFALRTIFIRTLSVSYLGINGLFTNMLTVISLMEGGVGTAISFSLYRPLAEKNVQKVASLMKLYRRVFLFLGTAIAIVGFGLTPFLKNIIRLDENIDHLYLIYWLTILSTSSSYFFSYRRSLVIADQRADINTKNQIVFRIIRFFVLSLTLIIAKDFILYLVADIIVLLASNIEITMQVKKRYSTIEAAEALPLPKEEKKTILKHMSAGLIKRIGQTVVTSTDSILISSFISTALVGIYSNYTMIFSNLDIAVYLLFHSLTASVGNFAVEKSNEEAERLFDKLNLANYIVVGVITVCILCLSNPFIQIWAGDDYVLNFMTVIVLSINFYITSMCNSVDNFLSSQGYLYYKNRFRPLVEAIVNIVFSLLFVLVFDMNITGVFLGTTVCFVTGRLWMDPQILYKFFFKSPFARYMKRFALRTALLVLIVGLCYFATDRIFSAISVSVLSWLICALICLSVSCTVYYFVYHNSEEFIYLKKIVFEKLKKRRDLA